MENAETKEKKKISPTLKALIIWLVSAGISIAIFIVCLLGLLEPYTIIWSNGYDGSWTSKSAFTTDNTKNVVKLNKYDYVVNIDPFLKGTAQASTQSKAVDVYCTLVRDYSDSEKSIYNVYTVSDNKYFCSFSFSGSGKNKVLQQAFPLDNSRSAIVVFDKS